MRRRFSFTLCLAIALLALSAAIYVVHYLVFRDVHHILIYLVGDLAFLPLEVLLVVLIIERTLARREKQAKLQKLNMVVGAFFTEVGNRLLRDLLVYFDNRMEISRHLNITENWAKKDFRKAAWFAHHLEIEINLRGVDLRDLKAFLAQKRQFLLTLLENPSLLEHDRLTDLLWAALHLDEELDARPSLDALPDRDLEHIASDIRRLYGQLASEWLNYADHLKANYPFLFSLILRIHPFQEHPSAVLP